MTTWSLPADTGTRPRSGPARRLRLAAAIGAAVVLAACSRAPVPPPAEATAPPRLEANAWRTGDGARLPLTRWLPEGEPRGVVLALHGFAEHGGMFYSLAPHLAGAGYAVFAYDQRGFGAAPRRGLWPGRAQLVADARSAYRLLQRHHPGTPVYLLGHSMGAAVAMLAVTGRGAIAPAGTVLLAPAVQGWDTLPWYQRWALALGARLFPGAAPHQSWGRALTDVRVTDDPRIRRIQAGDPLVLEAVRLDMLHGLVGLMDAARDRTAALPPATLVLYGERDDIIPAAAACALLARLPARPSPRPRFALYPEGYHYLARDRQRRRTIGDILGWLEAPRAPLPSGAGTAPHAARARLGCVEGAQPARKRSGR